MTFADGFALKMGMVFGEIIAGIMVVGGFCLLVLLWILWLHIFGRNR